MKYRTFPTLLAVMLLGISGCSSSGNESKEESNSGSKAATPIENDSDLPTTISYLDEPAMAIHYQRTSGSYKDWDLWMWSEGLDGAEYTFNYADDYGIIAYYPMSMFGSPSSIGFIVKQLFSVSGDGNWKKDYDSDRFLDFDVLKMDEHQTYNCYLLEKKGSVYTDSARENVMDAVSLCEFTNAKTIEVTANKKLKDVKVFKNGAEITNFTSTGDKTKTIVLEQEASIEDAYRVKVTFEDDVQVEKKVGVRKLYNAAFDAKYNYDGELGAILDKENNKTIFRVWSPVSSKIDLRIYDNGTPTSVDANKGDDHFVTYEMTKGEKGVFTYEANSLLAGKYYTYVVTNSSHPEGFEIVDPYAKSAGVNGLRGMVVDFSNPSITPTNWESMDYLNYDPKELTVYETHVADVTSSESWKGLEENRYKYAGMMEEGTTYSEGSTTVSTGFDHIKELGVNAVQIIPFFDQANNELQQVFNWGYNPLNYNVVEGIYSKNPYDGYVRIKELRDLIKAYNEQGITIIMDVVYNHVSGLKDCNFDVLMPGYYFRYVESTGSASNGSGCGNETASDKYMFKKFMIDSTKFWTETYKIGGFRFDLMGLHDTQCMNELAAAIHEINPHAAIYGEPWAGGTSALPSGYTAATQANAKKYEGYGQFNDKMRDGMIAGGLSTNGNKGWITQDQYSVNPSDIVDGMYGRTTGATNDPNKSIAYVTCHDNYTLHDRAYVAGIYDEDVIEKMNVLANSVVFASQGITFMQAGEEMLRTKVVYDNSGNPVHVKDENGNDTDILEVSGNSYSSSYKTNELDYSRKISHANMFTSYQKMIGLKQNLASLHLNQEQMPGKYTATATGVIEGGKYGSILKATIVEADKTYTCYFVNGSTDENYRVDIPEGANIYLNNLGTDIEAGSSINLKKFQVLIYSK